MNQEWTIHGHRQHWTQNQNKAKNITLKIKTMLVYKHKDGGYEMPYHSRLSSHILQSLIVEHSG